MGRTGGAERVEALPVDARPVEDDPRLQHPRQPPLPLRVCRRGRLGHRPWIRTPSRGQGRLDKRRICYLECEHLECTKTSKNARKGRIGEQKI